MIEFDWITIDNESSKREILKKRERSKVDRAVLGEIHRMCCDSYLIPVDSHTPTHEYAHMHTKHIMLER